MPVDAESGDGTSIASVESSRITDVRPNPAESTARIRFSIERAGPVSLVVLDVAGRVVRVLQVGHLARGVHERVWDGRSRQGEPAPSGVYFLRLRSPQREDVRRIARTR